VEGPTQEVVTDQERAASPPEVVKAYLDWGDQVAAAWHEMTTTGKWVKEPLMPELTKDQVHRTAKSLIVKFTDYGLAVHGAWEKEKKRVSGT
jgi:hypothetical protein